MTYTIFLNPENKFWRQKPFFKKTKIGSKDIKTFFKDGERES